MTLTMDKKGSQIFKRIVVNGGEIPGNLLNDYGFSFQTVFHRSSYLTYRCCTCAFEHEYFDYIDESGNINQDMLDRIVECLRNGECPHVNMVPEECVTETNVNVLHVVAATGSEEQLVWYIKNIKDETAITTELFRLQPYLITLLKNKRIVRNTNYNILRQYELSLLTPTDFKANTKFLYAQRSRENCQTIRIQKVSISEVCVYHRSTPMLKYFFKTTGNQYLKFLTYTHSCVRVKPRLDIAGVYEMAYRLGLVQGKDFIPVIQELFARKLPCIQYRHRANNDEFAENELDKFVETIVVCDQPEVLDCLFNETGLEMKCRCSIQAQSGRGKCSYCKVYKTCLVLGRTECEKVIERHHRMDLSNSEKMAKEGTKNNLKQTGEHTPHEAENSNELETERNKTMTKETNFECELKTDIKEETDDSRKGAAAQNANLISVEAKLKKLLSLIIDHPYSKDDIKEAFKTIPNLSVAIRPILRETVNIFIKPKLGGSYMSIPQRSIPQPVSRRQGPSTEPNRSCTENIEIIRTLIEIGADIDRRMIDETIILDDLLNRQMTNKQFTEIEYRQLLELFLYANPSVDQNLHAVSKGLRIDFDTINNTYGHWRQTLIRSYLSSTTGDVTPWTYVMDAKEHFFFSENPATVCFNFTGPLLLECGFPIMHRKLQEALTKQHHPNVITYLQQCYDIPRPLKHCCRDVLRKYWQGRKIHEFVNRSRLPEYIKDFILLKTVLHTL